MTAAAPQNLERVFTLIELNAEHVPVFRKLLAGELAADDMPALDRALKHLGLWEFAGFASGAEPEVLKCLGMAQDVFARAKMVRSLFDAIFR